MSFQERIAKFEHELQQEEINLDELKNLCMIGGIPDTKSFRALCWRLLLNFIPPKRSKWEEILKQNRDLYYQFLDEIVTGEPQNDGASDHPLSIEPDSKWKVYFKDNDSLNQIDRDVRRTLPDMAFFQKIVDFDNDHKINRPNFAAILSNRLIKKPSQIAVDEDRAPVEYHWQVIERILFIYAKLNPGVSYVQGMNDILGPLYFVFANDPDLEWRRYAEADCFFCFVNVMSEIRDIFVKSLDNSSNGIKGLMAKLNMLLKEHAYDLWENMDQKLLNPQYYSFRWLTLLLSQEFKLPEVIRLWDTLFADPNRFDFMIYFCCAMMVSVKEEIMEGDFAENLSLLQNYPNSDIDYLIQVALRLKEKMD